ncbi:killer cell lectin-like receptor 5 [Phyllostomus hastatus]|uniref:killer cell lectin-like receptor 5 n=1 Tax=Phyllostomus hastatus TaxID=9423 RepID=UPI001E68135D|nr:killer cell lectin-like receptor 5 [Phyllostomus hastatus]
MGYKLLKIEDEKELKFIQIQLSSKSFYSWIGLTCKGANNFWTWEDNSPTSLSSLLFVTKQQTKAGSCVRITARKTEVSDCSRPSHYVCERRLQVMLPNNENKKATTEDKYRKFSS